MKKVFLIGNLFMFSVFSFMSSFSFAEAVNNVCEDADMKSIEGILNWGTCLLSGSVIPLLFALAVTAFIWGIIQFYLNPENEEKRKKGKAFIVGGLIALFVMISFWGIVNVFRNTFELEDSGPGQLPGIGDAYSGSNNSNDGANPNR